jgi:polysaccharide biosynthesis protein PslH
MDSPEDQQLGLKQFGLDSNKTSVVPYGIELPIQKHDVKSQLRQMLRINPQYIFHFNGTMDYEPNMEAVGHLVDHVNPILKKTGLDYTIVISGKRLPANLQDKIRTAGNMMYTDFFDDIEMMYQGSDVFLNTVTNDSGVKTKVIEALGQNCPVVSTHSGAAGIPQHTRGDQLLAVPDHNWQQFVNAIKATLQRTERKTPEAFFTYFSWTNIAAKAHHIIQQVAKHDRSIS